MILYKSGAFSLKHPETFDISHAFLPLIVTKLSMLKQVLFLDHHVYTVFHKKWHLFLSLVGQSNADQFT